MKPGGFKEAVERARAAHDDQYVKSELAREAREVGKKQAEKRLAYLESVGLARRHVRELDAGGLSESPALKAMRKVAGAEGMWVLSGPAGCGKTMAAHWWLLDGLNGGLNVAMVTASKFARLSRYVSDGDDKFVVYARPHRLAVDDLGVEFADAKSSFLTDLDELLDLRWRAERSTVMTTNLEGKEFRDRYGVRIVDRIRHQGGWLNVGGKSLRERKG